MLADLRCETCWDIYCLLSRPSLLKTQDAFKHPVFVEVVSKHIEQIQDSKSHSFNDESTSLASLSPFPFSINFAERILHSGPPESTTAR